MRSRFTKGETCNSPGTSNARSCADDGAGVSGRSSISLYVVVGTIMHFQQIMCTLSARVNMGNAVSPERCVLLLEIMAICTSTVLPWHGMTLM